MGKFTGIGDLRLEKYGRFCDAASMRILRAALAGLARLCLSSLFLASGINKIIYWKEAEKQFLAVLGDWQTYASAIEGVQHVLSSAVVWAPLILMVATFLEILGSLLLLFGLKERLGAGLLALILIPTTVLMHHFWFAEGSQKELQLSLFLRDLAILGGLLVVVLHGGRGETSLAQEDAFAKIP